MENNIQLKERFEKLHRLFSEQLGQVDQYDDLEEILKASGFRVRKSSRERAFFTNEVDGRFEIFLQSPEMPAEEKVGIGDSLGQAVIRTVVYCETKYFNRDNP